MIEIRLIEKSTQMTISFNYSVLLKSRYSQKFRWCYIPETKRKPKFSDCRPPTEQSKYINHGYPGVKQSVKHPMVVEARKKVQ
jgi:hypothetical protein